MPTRIYPAWVIEEKAKNRLIFCCRIAKRFPTSIVAIARKATKYIQVELMPPNTLYNVPRKIKTAAPLETTDRKAVTATGDPSYTSAVHRWKGTTEILKANPATRKTKARSCN